MPSPRAAMAFVLETLPLEWIERALGDLCSGWAAEFIETILDLVERDRRVARRLAAGAGPCMRPCGAQLAAGGASDPPSRARRRAQAALLRCSVAFTCGRMG